jgi:hypothetical protein
VSPRPLKLRLLLFLYGSSNLIGSALALLGPLLLLTGVIGSGWWLITLGLYAGGYLIGRRAPEIERQIETTLSTEQTLERLDALIEHARPLLDTEMRRHLDGVRESVAAVLPRIAGVGGLDDDAYTVHETVIRYLPETLANYAALPPIFRSTQVLADGKTAKVLLGEQLALLDTKLREVVANVAHSDARALVANGRFLKQKFAPSDFGLH